MDNQWFVNYGNQDPHVELFITLKSLKIKINLWKFEQSQEKN